MVQQKPEKLPDLLETIRECIDQERFQFSKHALDRVKERGIDIHTTLYVLLNGYEEKRKTTFDLDNQCWKYAIRGKTVDELDVRVVIIIDEGGMIVITVMHVL